MQYILTEAEYKELQNATAAQLELNLKELQELCTSAAMHVPIKRDWAPKDTTPWGCVLGPIDQHPGYCDECPAQKLCPYEGKEWSQ